MKVSDELDTIVMRKLMKLLGSQINELTVWLDKGYDQPMHDRIDEAQRRIDKVREWANAQPDREIRAAYLGWLDNYYERGLDSAREEMRTRALLRSHENSNAEQARRRQATSDYAATHDVPEPTL